MQAFPNLEARVQWVVGEDDLVVAFYRMRGTQQEPWLFVHEPTGRVVETAFLLALQLDDDGQIIDQWLGSNFVELPVQLGWASPRTAKRRCPHTEHSFNPLSRTELSVAGASRTPGSA